jgi:hypothetical protein
MWHFSMQGLPANDVAIKSCGLLPHIFNLTPALSFRRGRRQLFSVALSVTSTYFSALVEIPGYSPVHCSVLSRLSSPAEAKAITRFAAKGKFKKDFRTIIYK